MKCCSLISSRKKRQRARWNREAENSENILTDNKQIFRTLWMHKEALYMEMKQMLKCKMNSKNL